MLRISLFFSFFCLINFFAYSQTTPAFRITSDAKAVNFVKSENGSASDKLKQNKSAGKTGSNQSGYDFMLDYAGMPMAVKEKISNNKRNNVPAYEGVIKNYFVNIPEINGVEVSVRRLSFLRTWKGYVSSRFISGNQVCISISPLNKSEELKEVLSTEFQIFDFISETYSLK